MWGGTAFSVLRSQVLGLINGSVDSEVGWLACEVYLF